MSLGPFSHFLPNLPFWQKLSPEEKAMVSDRCVTKRFGKNQMIHNSKTSCLGIIFILSGGIRVGPSSPSGARNDALLFHA